MEFDDSTPLYYQLANEIKKQIDEGVLPPMEKLKTEKFYSDYYKVSRVTVRKALDELCASGCIEHKLNKGHFVTAKNATNLSHRKKIPSIHQKLTQSGRVSSSDILKMETIKTDENLSAKLDCAVGESVIMIHRIRKVDGIPYASQKIWLREKLFPDLNPWWLKDQSLRTITEEHYGYEISHHIEKIEACMPTQELVDLLKIQDENPMLHIISQVYSTVGTVTEYSETYYLTSEFAYKVTTSQELDEIE